MADNNIMDKIKANLFPTVLSAICLFIWRDITELKSDVKELLAQSNISKTKIESLERDVYSRKRISSTYVPWFKKLVFKHEEFITLDKIQKENII